MNTKKDQDEDIAILKIIISLLLSEIKNLDDKISHVQD
jgi:hypothetical protein